MQPLRYSINITLDGCVDHEAGVPDAETHAHATALLTGSDHLVFGRKTYALMEFWRPIAAGAIPEGLPAWTLPFAKVIDAAQKYVVSDTLAESPGWNTILVRNAALEATIRRLKAEPGRGILVGGVAMPLFLAERGLIDEYEFVVHPRIAGRGPALLAGLSQPLALKLVDRKEFSGGAVALRYVPA